MLVVAGVFMACGKGDDAAQTSGAAPAGASTQPQNVDEDLADVTKYRLTMDKFDKYLAAQRNIALKMNEMSPAQREAMEASGGSSGDQSLDEMARKFETHPVINSAIRSAGLSGREFAVMTVSIMQTGMAAGIAKMRPNDNQDSLIREMKANPENVKFFQQNEAELTRKQKELEAEMKRLGVTDDS